MGNRFLDSGNGAPSTPFETEADAATTLQAILTDGTNPLLAGEDIFIAADHSEDPGANIQYNWPGTPADPNRIISATLSGPTYNKADNIQIDNDGGTRDINHLNSVRLYGVSLRVGDDLTHTDATQDVLYDDCILEFSGGTSGKVTGGSSSSGRNRLRLKNTDVNFAGGGAAGGIDIAVGEFEWEGGLLSLGGTQPFALFNNHQRLAVSRVHGVDLSALTTALVDVGASGLILAEFHHCKLNSGVALVAGTISTPGTRVLMYGCDDTTGNNLERTEYVDYYGGWEEDHATYRDAGAAVDGNNISVKMITTANAKEFSEALVGPPIDFRVGSTGSKTFTVNCLWDSATDIQNDEIRLRLEFLPTAADTQSDVDDDGPVDVLASPADQTTNAETWTISPSMTNANEFELSVTKTINRVGLLRGWVELMKPSTTIFFDPKGEVT